MTALKRSRLCANLLILGFLCFPVSQCLSDAEIDSDLLGSKVTVPLDKTEWEGEGNLKVKIKNSTTGEKYKWTTYPIAVLEFKEDEYELEDLIDDGKIKGSYLIDLDNKFVLNLDEDKLVKFVEKLLDDDNLGETVFPKTKIKMKFKISDDPLTPSSVKVSVSFSFETTLSDGSDVGGKIKSKHTLYLQ